MKDILMEILMRVTSSTEKPMAKVFIIGPMERYMTENGKKESRMDTECGVVYSEIVTWDNGSKVKLMVMEFINGKTVIDTKVVLKMT